MLRRPPHHGGAEQGLANGQKQEKDEACSAGRRAQHIYRGAKRGQRRHHTFGEPNKVWLISTRRVAEKLLPVSIYRTVRLTVDAHTALAAMQICNVRARMDFPSEFGWERGRFFRNGLR